MKFIAVLLTLFFGDGICYCQQSLIDNGNFEEYWECPYQQNDTPIRSSYWYQASEATSDYLNSCSSPQDNGCAYLCATVPQNTIGFQLPHSGEGYCGFVAYTTNAPLEMQYKEYIGSRLPTSLETSEYYVLSFFVSLGDSCKYAVDQIGCHLSADSLIIPDQGPSFVSPLINNPNGILTDQENWMEIRDTFQATGLEKYITIGSFGGYSDMNIMELPMTPTNVNELTAYYYVDDVTLTQLSGEFGSVPATEIPNILTPNNDNANEFIDFDLYVSAMEQLIIVNRWGNVVHEGSKGKNSSWSGRDWKSGEKCSDGVYFYVINTPTKTISGNIQLIR